MRLQNWAILAGTMWCHERKRRRLKALLVSLTCAAVTLTLRAGSVAAAESQAPSLKVSGKATFGVEVRGLGGGFELSAVLSDEVGRPLPNAEVRVRALAD